MSSLVNRIQRAILGGAGPAKVRELLTELQIPAGQTPAPDCLEQVRRVILYSGATVEEMREAFANVGISGTDPAARAVVKAWLLRDGESLQ